jgi:methyl-accepting chemotaxis protein
MVFFFVIIAGLSILSAYHLNRLSQKTDAILKENHFSVIFARDMAEDLTILNQEVTRSFVTGNGPDSSLIAKTVLAFAKSLLLEKNNITEAGEDKLVSGIESGFDEYHNDIVLFSKSSTLRDKITSLQAQFNSLYQQTLLLSQMNGQAIILKASDTKKSAEKGLTQVTIFGTICFIIAFSFTFNFASYFNERFSKLYNGIKEIRSSNYSQRLYFEGEDEFYDLSLIFNDMAKNLDENKQNPPAKLKEDFEREISLDQVQELKRILDQMQGIKVRAINLIAKLEHKE